MSGQSLELLNLQKVIERLNSLSSGAILELGEFQEKNPQEKSFFVSYSK